jgi:hypothetical protein
MSSFTLDSLTFEEVLAGRLPSNPYVVPAEAYAEVYGTGTRGKKLCDIHREHCDVGMHGMFLPARNPQVLIKGLDSDDTPELDLDATTDITKAVAPVVLPPYPQPTSATKMLSRIVSYAS